MLSERKHPSLAGLVSRTAGLLLLTLNAGSASAQLTERWAQAGPRQLEEHFFLRKTTYLAGDRNDQLVLTYTVKNTSNEALRIQPPTTCATYGVEVFPISPG